MLGERPLVNLKYGNKPGEQPTAEILINHSGGTVIVADAPAPLEIVGRAAIVGWGRRGPRSQYDIGLSLWNLRFYSRNRTDSPALGVTVGQGDSSSEKRSVRGGSRKVQSLCRRYGFPVIVMEWQIDNQLTG